MGLKQLLINARLCATRSLILFATLTTAACNTPSPLKIDPCGVYWQEATDGKPYLAGWCVPLNQPGKPEYERWIKPKDVCVTADEYAAVQKSSRDLEKDLETALKKCAERCQ